MESRSSLDKRFALLIDADNVSAKYIKPILDELSKYGTITYKRIYGDWTSTLHAKWKDALLDNSITPIQQFSYTVGKNATDSAMIIDAMDILYTNSVEGFCLVSSDSDFTRLASRIRESGLTVIGMGEKKTPTPFRKACDVFTTLELLVGEARRGKEGASSLTIEEVERAVVDIITDNQNNGKATGLGEVGSRLLKRYPDFDVRSFGTNLLSKLLGEFKSVNIRKEGSNVHVELAEGAEHEHALRASGDKTPRAGKAPDEGKPVAKAQGDAGAPAASSTGDDSSEAHESGEEEAASAAGEGEASTARGKSRRRRGRRRKSVSVPEGSNRADGAASDDAADGGRATDEERADGKAPASLDAPLDASAAPDASLDAPAQAEGARGAGDASSSDDQASAESDAPAASKPARRRPRRTKKDATASPADAQLSQTVDAPAEAASQTEAVAPVPAEEPSEAPAKKPRRASAKKPATAKAKADAPAEASTASAEEVPAPKKAASRKASKKTAGDPRESTSQKRKPGSGAKTSRSRKPASERTSSPDDFIREAVAAAGEEGLAVSELSRRVRAKFKSFKVRDLGYPHMAGYLADVDGVRVFKQGRENRVAAE